MNLSKANPLIIVPTAVNSSAPFTSIENKYFRIERVLWGVKKLLETYPEYEITLCDGTDFDFSKSFTTEELSRIEILFFANSADKVRKFGKGYGECEILEYVMENSKKVDGSTRYIKITGGLHVKNLSRIFSIHSEFQFYPKIDVRNGIPRPRITSVDTRVLFFSRAGFDKYLRGVKKNVNDYEGVYLEHAVFQSIRNSGSIFPSNIFIVPPKILGVSGSTGKAYTSASLLFHFLYIIRNIKLLGIRYLIRKNISNFT